MTALGLAVTMAVAMVAVSPSAAQTIDDLARAQLGRGEAKLNAADLKGAEADLRVVDEKYPSTVSAHWARVRLSECLFHQNRFDDCILQARRVVNLYPGEAPQVAAAWAQVYVGLGYKGKGQLEKEIWELEKVGPMLAGNPDQGPALKAAIELALAHHNRNNRSKAISLCQGVIAEPKATDADRAWAQVILGSALIDDWKFEAGFAELQKVREQYPGFQEHLLAAERKLFEGKYIGRHDYDGAISEGRAIADNPASSEGRARQARRYVALAYLYKKDWDAAIAEAQALLDKYPTFGEDHRDCQVIKARAHAMKRDYVEAIACLEAALATNPPDVEFRATTEWDIATCYKALGDVAQANAHYQKVVDTCAQSHLALRARTALGGQP